ncbi:MAG TPA: SHOCT domain-containing protein [Solirubrobacteraceae bacterium]|nr:SHOCT domain-containing protein [Solirubrobacteraceae bacterium]
MARTAVVAGTATTVSNRVSRRQQGRWAAQEQQQMAAAPPQQQAYAAPPAPPAQEADPMERLKELGQLHESGVLTDQEFADAKAKILG